MDIVGSIANSRLVAQQRALDVIADNIANANTPGFKAESVAVQRLAQPTERHRGGAGRQHRRLYAGPRDMARPAAGHADPHRQSVRPRHHRQRIFHRQHATWPRLTRDGRFGLMPDGTVADSRATRCSIPTGKPVLLSPTDTQISIAGDGTLSSENGQLAKVGVVSVADPMQMAAEGNTLFRATAPTAAGRRACPGAGRDRGLQRPARAGDNAHDG